MNVEYVDHAARVLALEPTRTLSVYVLAERISVQLRADVSAHRLLDLLKAQPDRFAIAKHDAPLGDSRILADGPDQIAELERAGVLPGATVVLLGSMPPSEPLPVGNDVEALRAALADTYDSVLDLLHAERMSDGADQLGASAVVELDQLRTALGRESS